MDTKPTTPATPSPTPASLATAPRQRVAVDDQQVGPGARGDLAELALLAEDLRVDDGRRAEDLLRPHRLPPDEEFPAVVVLQLPEEVAAEADLDAGPAAELERAQ